VICFLFPGATAISADANNPQKMLGDFEPVLCGHSVLYRFKFCRVKLNDLAAFGTDHVVVMFVFVIVLVVCATIAKAK